MTQTVVNFISNVQYDTNGQITAQSSTPFVFDFLISQEAQDYYTQSMNQLQDYLNESPSQLVVETTTSTTTYHQEIVQIGTDPFGIPIYATQWVPVTTTVTTSDLDQMNRLLKTMYNWAQMRSVLPNGTQVEDDTLIPPDLLDGYTLQSNPDPNKPASATTMNMYMAQKLGQFFAILRTAGYEVTDAVPDQNALLTAIQNIQTSPNLYPASNAINAAITITQQAHVTGMAAATQSESLQQALMVDYISVGNELLSNQLGLLNTAINTNSTVLSYLNSLQDLMNQKNPETFIQQLGSLFSSSGGVIPDANYESYETQTFNQTLGTNALYTDSSLVTYVAAHPDVSFSQAFSTSIATPGSTTFVTSIDTIIANLQALNQQIGAAAGSSNGVSSAGGVTTALTQLITDFQNIKNSSTPTIAAWIEDNLTNNSGTFQTDLNNAMVACQSFNDTQREQLQQTMFVYEEFYKSATSLLENLDQIIKKMASNINR